MKLMDLEPLEDIMDILVFHDEPSIFNEKYANQFIETILHIIDEFIIDNPTLISEPNFQYILLDEVKELFYIQMEEPILRSDYVEYDMNEIIEYAVNIYLIMFNIDRLCKNEINELESNKEITLIEAKIQSLRELPQPIQRTPEWYKFRWNLITASSAWKAFQGQSTINQLIYEKCQPLKDHTVDEEKKIINTNTTLHWGQKYEPLSVMLYEHIYDSKVEDFGCICHTTYKFIGASPDGIITQSNTGRYGRMLEIKNIVNREINGIPKKEYWIQMQLQMEVCDLDECDFLETKFVEYSDCKSYYDDSLLECFDGEEFNSNIKTKEGSYKGVIIYFYTKDGKPYYEYMPLNLWKSDDITKWQETIINKYETEPYNYLFIKFLYWKLEKLSCVLVLRNKEWFKNNVEQLQEVWNTIEKERETGYQHREPAKKTLNNKYKPELSSNEEVCLLKVIKIE